MVISMDRWRGKVAIVTGASAGIGAAIVEQLVTEGLQVAGFARRSERVQELAKKLQDKKGKLFAVKVDLTNEEEIIKGFKWVTDNLGPVHILVNNAGVIQPTNLTEGDTKMWKKILDTNVLGLSIATREAVKIMNEKKIDGHIVHINSVAGHTVPNIPNINMYPASKHAVTALTETLRQELNHLGLKIKITSVSPGAVDTEIVQANNFQMNPEMENLMPEKLLMLKSEDIADAVLYALGTPPHVQVHELTIKPVGEKF
ncbi:farnesol dehydrogenase [Tribolium castaneum]|uniref:Dehydrogenase/reductase SDR family protein 7-like n=1 Tax=Tribolium castaneum TaxID=7070 RepID=D7ELE5_TRICA|nr:PREDICTED: farnesol dehydrogenase [Tribolium castaneum]EFA12017.1 Dehydrogenase/reductase SDR family protein 7-like [Tribolium castaneum]|eukprot:XP_970890.1 PREDICTED: farnesol dehydrogenase [Tribolium castaneum]